jgi:hypothetical protein
MKSCSGQTGPGGSDVLSVPGPETRLLDNELVCLGVMLASGLGLATSASTNLLVLVLGFVLLLTWIFCTNVDSFLGDSVRESRGIADD